MPVAVVASAGTVNQGAIDPIAALADVAEAHGTWLHVDGAYGLFGVLDPRISDRLRRPRARRRSAAVDPHKWLAVPVGVGAAYVRDRRLLARTFTMEPTEYIDGAFVSPVGAALAVRRARHAAPRLRARADEPVARRAGLGRARARSAPRACASAWCATARSPAAWRSSSRPTRGWSCSSTPTLSICTFRYVAPGLAPRQLDDLNARIASELRAEGRVVPSTTTIAGAYAIRPCFINPRTTPAEIDELAASVAAARRRAGPRLTRPVAG